MELVKPFALQTGDKIGIVAPSMHIIDEEAVKNGISTLRELGFNVEVGPTVYSKYRNTTAVPSDRVREIMDFFTDSETKAIICLIGGDTVVQLLKLLDYETIQNNPKIFSGMSDIGHLSLAFLSKANLVSIYGLDLTFGFGADKNNPITRYNIDSFIKCCTCKEPLGKMQAFTQWECWRPGKARGRLTEDISERFHACTALVTGLHWRTSSCSGKPSRRNRMKLNDNSLSQRQRDLQQCGRNGNWETGRL